MMREYDEDLTKKVFARLLGAEESDFASFLACLVVDDETMVRGRFLAVLKRLGRLKNRQKAYAVARVMMQMLAQRGWSVLDFVLAVMREDTIKTNRLHLATMLNYYTISPSIILADLFNDQHNGDDLTKAANNFPADAVLDLLRFVAVNSRSPKVVLAAMRKEDVFRERYVVDIRKCRFSEPELAVFVRCCCKAIGAEIPVEVEPLFLRIRLDKELEVFFRGETEIEDFYNICVGICKNRDNLMAYCVDYVAPLSNPIAKFMSRMKNIPFVPSETARNYAPICATIGSFHDLACGKSAIIQDFTTASEFDERLTGCRQLAAYYHIKGDGKNNGVCDLFAFRIGRKIYFFLPKQSRHQKEMVAESLKRNRGKRLFVYRKEASLRLLREEFKWKPSSVIDVGDIARDESISESLSDMAVAMTGGCCNRGRTFAAKNAIPSPMALLHLDANVSLIYNFAVHYLNLQGEEIREGLDDLERRKRARERGDDDDENDEHSARKKSKKSKHRSRAERH